MPEPQKPKTPKEIIDAHDLEARLKGEYDILQKVNRLTNGDAGDENFAGKINPTLASTIRLIKLDHRI